MPCLVPLSSQHTIHRSITRGALARLAIVLIPHAQAIALVIATVEAIVPAIVLEGNIEVEDVVVDVEAPDVR